MSLVTILVPIAITYDQSVKHYNGLGKERISGLINPIVQKKEECNISLYFT